MVRSRKCVFCSRPQIVLQLWVVTLVKLGKNINWYFTPMALPPEVCTFRPCSGSLIVPPFLLYWIVVSNLAVLSYPWILRPADHMRIFYLDQVLRQSLWPKKTQRKSVAQWVLFKIQPRFFWPGPPAETLFRDIYNNPQIMHQLSRQLDRGGNHDTRHTYNGRSASSGIELFHRRCSYHQRTVVG